eukprot:1122182-Pelagomonas_calceolata.AAC.1
MGMMMHMYVCERRQVRTILTELAESQLDLLSSIMPQHAIEVRPWSCLRGHGFLGYQLEQTAALANRAFGQQSCLAYILCSAALPCSSWPQRAQRRFRSMLASWHGHIKA